MIHTSFIFHLRSYRAYSIPSKLTSLLAKWQQLSLLKFVFIVCFFVFFLFIWTFFMCSIVMSPGCLQNTDHWVDSCTKKNNNFRETLIFAGRVLPPTAVKINSSGLPFLALSFPCSVTLAASSDCLLRHLCSDNWRNSNSITISPSFWAFVCLLFDQ